MSATTESYKIYIVALIMFYIIWNDRKTDQTIQYDNLNAMCSAIHAWTTQLRVGATSRTSATIYMCKSVRELKTLVLYDSNTDNEGKGIYVLFQESYKQTEKRIKLEDVFIEIAKIMS